ncbi:MAG: hypothetical protein HQL13_02795 [Candidatus Omnitrophica bacterium]|nr:hypothetical protein [Candidatus Omnitrophota bacterium]
MNLFSWGGLTLASSTFFLCILLFIYGRSRLHYIWLMFNLVVGLWGVCAFILGGIQDPGKALNLWRIAHIPIAFIPVLNYHIVYELCKLKERKILVFAYCQAFVFSLFAVGSPHFIPSVRFVFNSFYYDQAGYIFYIFFAIWGFFVGYSHLRLFQVFLKSTDRIREQILYFFFGTLIGFSGGATNFLPAIGVNFYPFGNFTIPLYCFLVTYAILRYKLLDIKIVVTRLGVFLIVYALVLGAPVYLYALGFKLVSLILAILLSTAGPFVYFFIQRRAEDAVLQEVKDKQKLLKDALKGMTSIRDVEMLLDHILNALSTHLELDAGLYLVDLSTHAYCLRASKPMHVQRASLPPQNPLVQKLKSDKKLISYEEIKFNGRSSSRNKDFPAADLVLKELEHLAAQWVLPLKAEDKLLGFIVLGKTRNKHGLSADLIDDLFVIEDQAALAIENALYWEAQRKQIHEESTQARRESLDMLVGTMAHEIDNPLSFVMGNAENLQWMVKGAILKVRFELAAPHGAAILNDLIKHAVVEEISENDKVISKFKISGVGLNGGKILNELIGKAIVEEVSPTEVRLKAGLDAKEGVVREIAQDDFNTVWEILMARPEVRLLPDLYQKQDLVREITKDDFEAIWSILQNSYQKQLHGVSPDIRNAIMRICSWIVNGTHRVSGIIKAVEQYSRKQKGPMEAVFINAMMVPMDSLLKLLKKKYKGVDLIEEINPDLPPVWGQVVLVEEIILNLVRNGMQAAIEKHPNGGGRVTLKIYQHEDHMMIETIDNGIGMKPEILKQVFQVPASHRGSMQGLGFGLYHVRRVVVEMLKGDVRAESPGEGQGAQFVITLPVYKGADLKPKLESNHAF